MPENYSTALRRDCCAGTAFTFLLKQSSLLEFLSFYLAVLGMEHRETWMTPNEMTSQQRQWTIL
ncbi:hypothetical protein I79_011843 [Cricetulus griseus]|uniref:Uncharacterized protein n=1 Tax=Cricetulus griseus TaxID=10029 RepID=G3HM92_CRIGR|nr:hypothetical protein I79_011843 [Cricetulus griseus]